MTEKKIEQKKGVIGTVVNYITGSILLIIGIIVLVLGIPHLFFGTIEGDMLQIMEYNTFSSLMVFLGIYISLFGLHFLIQKLNKSIKAYLLIVAGISIIIFSFIAPKILYSYAYLGLLAYIFLGFGSIVYGAYSLSKRYMPRKNLVYGNIGPIAIILILVIVFA
ncbi:MAG: hypothetical protein ACFE9C_14330 [Candidatus Hodarchaeota archaeon]